MRWVISGLLLFTNLASFAECTGFDRLLHLDFTQLRGREFMKTAHELIQMPEIRALWFQNRFADFEKQKITTVVSYSLGKLDPEECTKARANFTADLQKNFNQAGLEVIAGSAAPELVWVKPNARRGQLRFFLENKTIDDSVFTLIKGVMTAAPSKVVTLSTRVIEPVPDEKKAQVLSVTCFYLEGEAEECSNWATAIIKDHPAFSFTFTKPKEEK